MTVCLHDWKPPSETEKQFTSDASHELRTPIAVNPAQCEEAKLHALSQEEYAKAFDVVERQAKRMSTTDSPTSANDPS